MDKKKLEKIKKIVIVLGICIIVFIPVYYIFTINHGEGDPVIIFEEVPVTETKNHSVTHLTDEDILNKHGWEIIQNNGKITRIYFRDPYASDSSFFNFMEKYGGYIEYNGAYYYVSGLRP